MESTTITYRPQTPVKDSHSKRSKSKENVLIPRVKGNKIDTEAKTEKTINLKDGQYHR